MNAQGGWLAWTIALLICLGAIHASAGRQRTPSVEESLMPTCVGGGVDGIPACFPLLVQTHQ
jgi:hypothetical protein